MAYILKLGTFAKLENSTAQPTTTGWAEYSVNLKGGTDLINPTVTLNISTATLDGYNYATMMGNYYFIRGKNNIRGDLNEVELKLDPMATFKSTIGAASLYVLRSASSSDPAIRDMYYPPKAQMTFTAETDDQFVEFTDFSNGIFVINVFGTDTTGNSTLWQLTPDNFRSLLQELYTDISTFTLSDAVSQLAQYFGGNPTNLLTSAIYFPQGVSFVSASTPTRQIKIGGWTSTNSVGKKITFPVDVLPTFSPTIAAHPKAATRGTYLSMAPFAKYELYVPSVGIIDLDTSQLRGVANIDVERRLDASTGRMITLVWTDIAQPHLIAAVESQFGVPITLRGNNNGSNILSGLVGTMGSAALAVLTGGASAIVGAVASGIGTVADAIGGAQSNSSTNGAITNFLRPAELYTTFFDIPDDDNTHMGRPLCKVKTISSLSGYIRVSEGDVAIPAPLPIQQEVKGFLEGGFFYE